MLTVLPHHTAVFSKGEIIAFEQENMKHIGIVLSGAVDMIKEDLWGNKTLLVRMRKNELFGETFACGNDSRSTVTFHVETVVLFVSQHRDKSTLVSMNAVVGKSRCKHLGLPRCSRKNQMTR
ncbi:MAG: cyclic nucleotide-binding domain-containing protein [Ruminococcus sp.]